jgi:hypothetical protein
MAQYGTFTDDDRVLRALLLLTTRAERPFLPEFDTALGDLDTELPTAESNEANGRDTVVRSQLPRA